MIVSLNWGSFTRRSHKLDFNVSLRTLDPNVFASSPVSRQTVSQSKLSIFVLDFPMHLIYVNVCTLRLPGSLYMTNNYFPVHVLKSLLGPSHSFTKAFWITSNTCIACLIGLTINISFNRFTSSTIWLIASNYARTLKNLMSECYHILRLPFLTSQDAQEVMLVSHTEWIADFTDVTLVSKETF